MVKSRLALAAAPRVASALIRTLRPLLRWTVIGDEIVLAQHRSGQPYVHAFFHDQLLMMTYSYRGAAFGRRLAVLASRHRDGEYVSRTLERFGHQMVRGSTGRGGMSGLRQMVRLLRAGRDAAFATDGPRGPRHQVQIGVIEAARLGGAPIVPVAFAASVKKNSVRGTASRSPVHWRVPPSSLVRRSQCRPPPIAASWSGGASPASAAGDRA